MLDSFKVDARQQGALWILNTHGYINNAGGETIASRFEEAFKTGARKFIFDLEDSKIINSIGVSFLIGVLEKVLESGGELAFCNCAPIIEKTFKIMGITQYAKIFGTQEEAAASMQD